MDLLWRFRGYARPDGALAVVVRDQVAALNLPVIYATRAGRLPSCPAPGSDQKTQIRRHKTQISRPQPVISSP
jgi:hypothetical protein